MIVLAIATVIAAVAALVTIFFAYQTVTESRLLRREYEHDRRVLRLQRIAELVELISVYVTRGSPQAAMEAQASLFIALTGVTDEVPLTRNLSKRALAVSAEMKVEIERAQAEARGAVLAATTEPIEEESSSGLGVWNALEDLSRELF